MSYSTQPGRQHPLGAYPDAGGVNFALFSQHATSVELLLFDTHNDKQPSQIIKLDPKVNRSFYIWHCYVEGLKPGAHYAYRVDGPHEPHNGHRFNPNKVLIDPYAFGNNDHLWDRVAACGDGDNVEQSMRSVVIDLQDYDWEGDTPINRPMSESVIYEMNVAGFTRNDNANVNNPSTFAGIVEKIPYLKELGVTAIELLPVMEFDDKEILRITEDGRILTNFWGYSTLSFFAPDSQYCVNPEIGNHINEFRDMVKALHKAGIEVILDVVFNHTNEGNHEGPTINFKGIDNSVYYFLNPSDPQYYFDYSGCGNTLKCNHPVVEKMIVECLEFWVKELHVDGFRFDEGSILSRGEDGAPLEHAPVLWAIELSETLADTKIIAEAWDAAGLYQVGYFPGTRWAEWNGKYRDCIREFVAGKPGIIGEVAGRISGSADLYQPAGRLPINSVNFITCHDGFTLNDLVSYNEKHNEANGENNNDGINDNISWNCGWEGPSDDPDVEALRTRQVKNFITLMMLSRGVPMILAGDEVRRTQQGNNNAYCQDNEISWFDWSLTEKHADLLNYVQQIIAFRRGQKALNVASFFDGSSNDHGVPDVSWHGTQINSPGWNDPEARALSFTLAGLDGQSDIHVMMNTYWNALDFELPEIEGYVWCRLADTSYLPGEDFVGAKKAKKLENSSYLLAGRSIAILINKKEK